MEVFKQMHKQYSIQYFEQQLKEVTDDPIISEYGAVVSQDGDLSFILTATKSEANIRPMLRFDCSNFDIEPPLIEFIHPVTRKKLDDCYWPPTVGDHQLYGRAICLKETRGYHNHQSHETDSFDNYRNGFSLLRIVIAILTRINQWNFPQGGPYYENTTE